MYVNASEHGASGGHTALRIDDDVYHFQHFPDGLFRLLREDWEVFRHHYNDLESRTLRIADVAAAPADVERLRSRLVRWRLVQEKDLRVLAALEAEQELLAAFAEPGRGVMLRGAGLFAPVGHGDRDGLALRRALEVRVGAGGLARARQGVEARLADLHPIVYPLGDVALARDRYPAVPPRWSQPVLEDLVLREALRVLERAPPLADGMLIDPEAFDGAVPLAPPERARLAALASALEDSAAALLRSQRPDRGFALLLAEARYRAVRRSLAAGRLLVLDALPEAGEVLAPEALAGRRALFARLRARSLEAWRGLRARLLAGRGAPGPLSEPAWNALEEAGSRHRELARALETGAALRLARGRLLPERSGRRPAPRLAAAAAAELPRLRAAAERRRQRWREALSRAYGYDLLRRNCATELLRAVDAAYGSPAEVTRALGGRLAPGERASFVPAAWFAGVRARLAVSRVEVLPSLRLRALAERYAREPAWRVYPRETTTFTSTVYPGAADPPFLFFTDDVVWPRPLYGLANAAWGALYGGAGLAAWPLDGGRHARRGLDGLLASLPELAFFNVRKGSFEGAAP